MNRVRVLCSDHGRTTRRRLALLGADESHVVCAAGGLLYDWSLGGWDITVYLAEYCDDRPFRILGVKTELLDGANGFSTEPQWPDAIITSSTLYDQNDAVRGYLTEASRRNCAAVAILGDDWPVELGQGIGPVEHRLSAAARAFKVQAMIAAGRGSGTAEPYREIPQW